MRHLLTTGVCSLLAGCATTATEFHSYVPPSWEVPASQVALVAAAEQHVAQEGWTLVRSDRKHGIVEAVTTVDSADGTKTRERWVFELVDARVRATLSLEMESDGGGVWETTEQVCPGYAYARERHHLAELGQLAAATTTPGWSGASCSARRATSRPPGTSYQA